MKKFTLFIVVVLCIAHLVKAQLKLYVYENNGEVTEFVASNVDSIAFTAPGTYPINPKTEDYVDLGLSVRWATCNVYLMKRASVKCCKNLFCRWIDCSCTILLMDKVG